MRFSMAESSCPFQAHLSMLTCQVDLSRLPVLAVLPPAVLSEWPCPRCPISTAMVVPSLLSCPSYTVLAVIFRPFCLCFLYWMYYSLCPLWLSSPCSPVQLFCPCCPILAVLSRLSCPAVLFWPSCPLSYLITPIVISSFPAQYIIILLSSPLCLVLHALSQVSSPGNPVLTVLSWLSRAVRAWMIKK